MYTQEKGRDLVITGPTLSRGAPQVRSFIVSRYSRCRGLPLVSTEVMLTRTSASRSQRTALRCWRVPAPRCPGLARSTHECLGDRGVVVWGPWSPLPGPRLEGQIGRADLLLVVLPLLVETLLWVVGVVGAGLARPHLPAPAARLPVLHKNRDCHPSRRALTLENKQRIGFMEKGGTRRETRLS